MNALIQTIGGLVPLIAAAVGCESIVPREDLRAIAAALPPSPPVTDDDRDRIAADIRERTGVESFEFSGFEFSPETRLPSGTGWILGLFLGDGDAP